MKKGFTLLEMIIYMALLSILLVVMTQIFVSILDARSDAEAVSTVEQDGNYIMARLFYDIAQSTNIVTPSGAGGQGNTLVITVGGSSYTYNLNGANLELNDGTGAQRLNGVNTSISSINFRRIGPGDATDTLQVTYTVSSNVLRTKGVESKVYQTTISSRQ